MASYTVNEIQQALVDQGYMTEKDENGAPNVDGNIGPITTAAVMQWQIDKGIKPADGNLNTSVASKIMNNYQPVAPVTAESAPNILGGLWNTFKLPDIGATMQDYILNAMTSKINAVAVVVAAALVSFVNTHWGLHVDEATQKWIISGITLAGMALIGVLRTFFNRPKVASAMPLKVTNTKQA